MTPHTGQPEWKELFDDKSNKFYYWDAARNVTVWTIPNSKWRKYKDATSGNIFYVHSNEPTNRSWTPPSDLIGSPFVPVSPIPPTPPPSAPSPTPVPPGGVPSSITSGAGTPGCPPTSPSPGGSGGLAPNPLALAAARRAAKLGQKATDIPIPTVEVTNKTPVPVPPSGGTGHSSSPPPIFFPQHKVIPIPPPFPPSEPQPPPSPQPVPPPPHPSPPTSPISPWQNKRPPPIQANTSEASYIRSTSPVPPPPPPNHITPLPILGATPSRPISIPVSPRSPEKPPGLHTQLILTSSVPKPAPSPPSISHHTPSPPSASFLSSSPRVPTLSSSISPFGSNNVSFFPPSSSSPASSFISSSAGSSPSPSGSGHFPPPSPPTTVTPPSPTPPTIPRVPSSPLSLPRAVNPHKAPSPLKVGLAAVPETERAPSPVPPRIFLPPGERTALPNSGSYKGGSGTPSRSTIGRASSPRSKASFDGDDEEEGVDHFLDDRPLSTSGTGQSRSWGDKTDSQRPASPMGGTTASTPLDEIYEKEGWVWKKCPAGLRGFRVWQKRWFVIDAKTLSYFKKKEDKKPTGFLALQDIAKCDYLPKKRMGDRIDIKVKRNKRVYSLHTSSVDEARTWWMVINNATKRAKAGLGPSSTESTRVSSDLELTRLSPLLLMFAKAKFGKGIQQDVRTIPRDQQREIKEHMETNFFNSEKYTLQWLLENVMNPDKGHWVWDSRSDRDVLAEEDAKEAKRRELEMTKEEPAPPVLCLTQDCKIQPLAGSRLCVYHLNSRNIPPDKMSTEDRLVEMLRSPDFFRHLQKVFDNEEEETHGLAIRVLWILNHGLYDRKEANKQFDAYVTILCNAEKFNLEISNALLSILLTDARGIHKNEELRVAFYNPVINESVWKPIFGCICGSAFGLRKTALEDITTVLHDNLENCRSLQRIPNWQDCIYAVMTDIDKKSKSEDETVKTAFAYCINVLTMVHFEYFMQTDGEYFKNIISQSLQALHHFGGSCVEGAQIASILLGSLCSKLANNKKLFSLSDFQSREWANLKQIQKVAKKFIFITAYWNKEMYSSYLEDDESKEGKTSGPIMVSMAMRQGAPQGRMQTESKYILRRDRNKISKAFTDDITPPEQKDFGIHWSEDGTCMDILLCERMLGLFRALNISEYDPSLKPNMLDTEKTFLRKASKDYTFWEDAKRFCESVRVQDIEEHHLTTHRRVSHWAREFFEKQKKPADRKTILKEIQSKVNRGETSGGSTTLGASTSL